MNAIQPLITVGNRAISRFLDFYIGFSHTLPSINFIKSGADLFKIFLYLIDRKYLQSNGIFQIVPSFVDPDSLSFELELFPEK
jgi:hypothetical protein